MPKKPKQSLTLRTFVLLFAGGCLAVLVPLAPYVWYIEMEPQFHWAVQGLIGGFFPLAVAIAGLGMFVVLGCLALLIYGVCVYLSDILTTWKQSKSQQQMLEGHEDDEA